MYLDTDNLYLLLIVHALYSTLEHCIIIRKAIVNWIKTDFLQSMYAVGV